MPPPLPVWCLPELRLSPPLDALGESCLKSGLTSTTSSFEEEDSCSRLCFDSDCVAENTAKDGVRRKCSFLRANFEKVCGQAVMHDSDSRAMGTNLQQCWLYGGVGHNNLLKWGAFGGTFVPISAVPQ